MYGGAAPPDRFYTRRLDLNGDGVINMIDGQTVLRKIGTQCS